MNALNSEDAEKASNEEDDAHRVKSFEKIFETNAWGQSKSGPGSLIPETGRIRNVLDSVIEETKKYLNKDKIRYSDNVSNTNFSDNLCICIMFLSHNNSDITNTILHFL